ncbi:MAG TPA: aromatic ring-hydroxylating dioxygenase subunit alpha [Arenimonas sp.]|nr:aromatic ring-hydroxylating dioxygenase subunit alpha [Arenimonas sp.]
MNPALPDPLAPQELARATALDAAFYLGEGMLARDRRAVFARSWQLVGHENALAGIGDHLVTDLAGLPVLVVRDSQGVLRAFHNVCRHRAGPLATCDGKGAKALRCQYHGWTYTLEGVLRSAPEMAGTPDFEPSSIRLPELRVGIWQGLVFVGGEGAVDFADFSRGLDEPLRSLSPRGYHFHTRVRYEVACNWKIYCDNYLEGYHVPHIHPGLNRLLDYRQYLTECGDWFSYQYSPLESDAGLYGDGDALYYFIYPNTMLNLLPGRLQSNRVLPLGPDRCVVEFDYYYDEADAEAREARFRADHDFAHQVQVEDIGICEHVQRGLASGSYASGRLNPRRENALHHFHELLRAAYRATP